MVFWVFFFGRNDFTLRRFTFIFLFHPTLRALRALLADVVGRINNVTRALGALLLPPIKNVIPMPAFLAIGPDTPRRFQVNYAPSNPRRVGRQVGMYNKRCIPRLL